MSIIIHAHAQVNVCRTFHPIDVYIYMHVCEKSKCICPYLEGLNVLEMSQTQPSQDIINLWNSIF
jgi:hypothetical protein